MVGAQSGNITGVAADNHRIVAGERIFGESQSRGRRWESAGDAVDLMDRHAAAVGAAQRQTQRHMGRAGGRLNRRNDPIFRVAIIAEPDMISVRQGAR